MTDAQAPGNAPPPPGPAAVALVIAQELVTTHHLRLAVSNDPRLGELAGGYELGAVSLTGTRAAFVGFFHPPPDAEDAGRDLAARCAAAHRWGHQRILEQKADRCDVLLVALAPVAGSLSAQATDESVHLGVAWVDVASGTADAVLAIPRGMPSVGDLRRSARSVRDGAAIPTLAAVDLAERQSMATGQVQPTRRALIQPPVVTYSLIGLFVAIYLLEKAFIKIDPLTGATVSVVDFGALTVNYPGSSDWWRYVTSAFIHSDQQLFHVLGNSIAMLYIGRLVEQLYGRLVLLGVFLITALGGGLLWVGVNSFGHGSPGISLGASGGISGLMGLLILLGRVQGRDVAVGVAASIRQYVATYALLTVLFGFVFPGVNNIAHIGGFVTGALLSLLIPPKAQVGGRNLRIYEQGILVAAVAVAAVALAIGGYHTINAAAHPTTPFGF